MQVDLTFIQHIAQLLLQAEPSQQQNFWRDPIWQSIGTISGFVIGVPGLILAAYFGLKQTQRKALTYEIKSKSNIIPIADSSIRSDLKIFYQGKEVKNLYVVVIKFTNSGNQEIRSGDYESSVSLAFGDDAEILDGKVLDQSPEKLGVEFDHRFNFNGIVLAPILLNRGDSFTVQILVTNLLNIEVRGRIAGVKKIEEAANRSFNPVIPIATAVSIVLLLSGSRIGLYVVLTLLLTTLFKLFFPTYETFLDQERRNKKSN